MRITSSLRFLYIFDQSSLLCGAPPLKGPYQVAPLQVIGVRNLGYEISGEYRKVASSRPVYYSILKSFGKGHST